MNHGPLHVGFAGHKALAPEHQDSYSIQVLWILPVNLSCWKGPKGCTRQIYIYANILDRELHLNSLLRERVEQQLKTLSEFGYF